MVSAFLSDVVCGQGNPDAATNQSLVQADRSVTVVITHSAAEAAALGTATLHVVDSTHANPLQKWKELGSPDVPNATARAALLAASEYGTATAAVKQINSTASAVTVAMGPDSAVVLALSPAAGR